MPLNIDIKDGNNVTRTVSVPIAGDPAVATETTLSSAKGSIDSTNTKLDSLLINVGAGNETPAAGDTSASGLNGLFKRLLQRITNLLSLLPTSLGAKTAANSFSVTLATDGIGQTINSKLPDSVAAGATDSGNPLKVGGVYRSTPPTLANNSRGDLLLSNRSILLTETLDLVSNPNNINTVDSASSTVQGANNQNIITGNPTNNSFASAVVSGSSSFAVLITGTFVGTLQFERSLDNGTTWTSIGAFSAGTNYIAQTTTLAGAFHGNASSATDIRVRAIAWTSGVASIRILAGQGTGTITVGNPVRILGSVQYNDPAPVSVGTTSTSILAANSSRRHVLFVNDGSTKIYLSLTGTAVLGRGIPILPGGSYEINATNHYTGAVSAITSSGTVNLCVTEGT